MIDRNTAVDIAWKLWGFAAKHTQEQMLGQSLENAFIAPFPYLYFLFLFWGVIYRG